MSKRNTKPATAAAVDPKSAAKDYTDPSHLPEELRHSVVVRNGMSAAQIAEAVRAVAEAHGLK